MLDHFLVERVGRWWHQAAAGDSLFPHLVKIVESQLVSVSPLQGQPALDCHMTEKQIFIVFSY